MNTTQHALCDFTQRYFALHEKQLGQLPRFFCGTESQTSPCIVDVSHDGVALWQSKERVTSVTLTNLSSALSVHIPDPFQTFYTTQFSAPLQFTSSWGEGELLQCWDDDDFDALQKNLIQHVLMKRRLKMPDTFFIGLMDAPDQLIVMTEQSEAVYLEHLGQKELVKLSENLEIFLQTIQPIVIPPNLPENTSTHQRKSWWKTLLSNIRPIK